MNRTVQMNEFLQYWARVYAQNPTLPVDDDMLYSALMEYGLTEPEKKNPSIISIFPLWEEYFRNNPNLRVYRDNRQPRFLQFRSKGEMSTQHVKLYLSYPPDKMEYCVKKIFDFMASLHMANGSKVADQVRSDSIVLRLVNYDDALRVMNFVNGDPELMMYARPTNPFMMRNGRVGVSYDDLVSYNITLTIMMKEYFQYCRQTGRLNAVNTSDFRSYLNRYYQNTFKNSNNLKIFLTIPYVANSIRKFSSQGACALNYSQVLKLMIMQLDGNMNMEMFRSFYTDVKDYSKNRQMIAEYDNLLNPSIRMNNRLEDTASMEEIALVNSYIKYLYEKYQTEHTVCAYLRSYVEKKDINVITRDKNFRSRFYQAMSPERAIFIMGNNVEEYVRIILSEEYSQTEEPEIPFDENLLQDYIDLARKKYGDDKVEPYLAGYVKDGLKFITKENNFRNKFLQYLPPDKLLEITNQNISGYVQNYIREKNKNSDNIESPERKYEMFVRTCVATYQKYGYNQLRKAIECGFVSDYKYFTDGNENFRLRLANLSSEEFSNFCTKLLANYGVSMGNSNDFYEQCTEAIVQIVASQKEKQDVKQAS